MRRADPILAGLVLGIACGLVVGERARLLEPLAEGVIRLLQMAVLPYIVVSLTAAVGRLSAREGRFLAQAGGGVLLALWALVLLLVLAMPLAFPAQPRPDLFATTAVEPRGAFDLVRLYIPDNPFRSLSDNVVPAVVLFCLVVGVALMGVPGRERVIELFDVMTKAFERVNGFVARIMPIGVFAIAATSAGTLGVEQIGRIEVYLATYVVFACLAAFWVLPAFLAAAAGVPVREVLRASRAALVTAFSTGSLLLVLPAITSASRALAARAAPGAADTDATVDVLVPISFNFPHAGKLLTLGFVLFAGWFAGRPLPPADLPLFAAAGLLATFGSMNVALPFLLDLFSLPADLFQLFLAISVVGYRFQTLAGAMHTIALAVLGTQAARGRLSLSWSRLAGTAALAVAVTGAAVAGTRVVLTRTFGAPAAGPAQAADRALTAAPVRATVLAETPPIVPREGSALDRVARTGELRVGYRPNRLPFSYLNGQGELVGFDVDMMHRLAQELRARLVFVPLEAPLDAERLAARLSAGDVDLAVGAVEITTSLSRQVGLSQPYLDLTMALVVRDRRRDEFATRDALRAHDVLRIGLAVDDYYEAKVRSLLPEAELVRVTSKQFFDGDGLGLDALVVPAEVGFAWTLRHPDFTVVTPAAADRLATPVAYATARGDVEFRSFLDTWLLLKRDDGTIERLRRHWILGLDDAPRAPRWSVLRNVLGWDR